MRLHDDSLSAAPACAMDDLEVRRLFAVDFTATPTPVAGFYGPGDAVPMDLTVSNLGSTAAAAFTGVTNLFLSLDLTIGNADDREIGTTANIGALAAGGSEIVAAPFIIPPGTPAGDYYVAAVIDPLNITAESNEGNNTGFTPTKAIRVATEELTSNTILGSAGNDVITIEQHGVNTVVTNNGVSKFFSSAGTFDHLFIDGSTGADRIYVTNADVDIRLQITGGGGNDIIVGGNAGDELSGANGKDKVFGGDGNDYLLGSASADFLTGEAGDDTMSGAGGNDRLSDIFGRDHFLGGAGNDTFLCRDLSDDPLSGPDTVSGGLGTDKAQVNESGIYLDGLASIEELIA